MEEVFIPYEYGMEVTSHYDQISHGKLVFYFLFICFCFDQFMFVGFKKENHMNEFVFNSNFPFWFSCVCTFLTLKYIYIYIEV
jgi:hypothetical protein